MERNNYFKIVILIPVILIAIGIAKEMVLYPRYTYYAKPVDSVDIVVEELSGRDMLFYEPPDEDIFDAQWFIHLDGQTILAKPDGYKITWKDASGGYMVVSAPCENAYLSSGAYDLIADQPVEEKTIGELHWQWQKDKGAIPVAFHAVAEANGYRYFFAGTCYLEFALGNQEATAEFRSRCEDYCNRFYRLQ